MRVFPALAVLLAALTGGCVVSKAPLAGLGERAAPFVSGTTFEVFGREDAKAPWIPADPKSATFIAGPDRIYRVVDAQGKAEDGGYTFHAVGPDRYLVEAKFTDERYAYAVLQIRDGEGLVSYLECKDIDSAVVKQAKIRVSKENCWLDETPDPAGFLKRIAESPPEFLNRYVPVKRQ